MRRYVHIEDIRTLHSWQHQPSARLYMYMCMTCDWMTGSWHGTRRATCLAIGISDQAWRTALKNLEADGLIETPTQEATQQPTQGATQRVTQATVVIYRQLGLYPPPRSNPTTHPGGNPTTHPYNNNNNTIGRYSLTHARASVAGLVDEVADYIYADREEARVAIRAFLSAMGKKGKTWADEEDMRSHLMDWCLKRWRQVNSRERAHNLAEDRRQREERQRQEPSREEAALEEARRKYSYIEYIPKSARAADLVRAWHAAGAWQHEPLRSATAKLLASKPDLASKIRDILGFGLVD